MAKKIVTDKRRDFEIAHKLAGRPIPTWPDTFTRYMRHLYFAEQEAFGLFEKISRALGPDEAKTVFKRAAYSKEGSKYSWPIDRGLLENLKQTGSPDRTAQNAIKAGDGRWREEDHGALVQHIKRLRNKHGLPKRQRGRPKKRDK